MIIVVFSFSRFIFEGFHIQEPRRALNASVRHRQCYNNNNIVTHIYPTNRTQCNNAIIFYENRTLPRHRAYTVTHQQYRDCCTTGRVVEGNEYKSSPLC